MNNNFNKCHLRELLLTPTVIRFLENCSDTQNARQLMGDIIRAVDGTDKKDGCIRLTAPTFLIFIIDPAYVSSQERVIVWHGPSDGGAFFNTAILQKAVHYSINLV